MSLRKLFPKIVYEHKTFRLYFINFFPNITYSNDYTLELFPNLLNIYIQLPRAFLHTTFYPILP